MEGKGETFIEVGIRETKEETGLNIYNLNFLYKNFDDNVEVNTYYTYDYIEKFVLMKIMLLNASYL